MLDVNRIKNIKENYSLEQAINDYGQDYPLKKIGRDYRSNSFIEPGTGKNKDNKVHYDFIDNLWCDHSVVDPKTNKKYGGNVIHYVQYVKGLDSYEAAAEFIEKEKGLSTLDLKKIRPRKTSLYKDILQYHDNINSPKFKAIKDHLIKERGYYPDYLEENLIGFIDYGITGRIVYPIFDSNFNIVYYEARALNPELNKKVYPNNHTYSEPENKFIKPSADKYGDLLNKEVPYNYYTRTNKSGDTIFICEGVADSDTLNMINRNNLCMSGTHYTDGEKWEKYFLPVLKNHNKIVFFGDNDDDGRAAVVNHTINGILKYGLSNVYVQIVPKTWDILNSDNHFKDHFTSNDECKEKYGEDLLKDINDICKKDISKIKETDKNRIPALEYIGRYYHSICKEEELATVFYEKAIKPIYRFLEPYQIDSALQLLEDKEIFTAKQIKRVKGYMNKPLLDKAVVNELIADTRKKAGIKDPNKKTLIYDEKTAFYCFNGKIWEELTDSYIDGLIEDKLGYRFTSGSKIDSVRKSLKSSLDVNENNPQGILFNRSDVLVFNNGTLYLNEGRYKFKEEYFNPDDRVTFFSNFNYDDKAECPKWKQFLDDVTANYNENGELDVKEQELKKLMLQLYAGYILFSDCPLQKCLVLFGEGSNGKSVFEKTIEKLFDDSATTSIPATLFSKDHILYELRNSILNISGETKDSFFNSEENIRGIVTGDRMAADRKYKDPINFTPRTKLLILANNPFRIKDSSNATYRRFLFVFFNTKFESDENKINGTTVKKKNLNLEKELEEELAGIFNWMLEGYCMLKDLLKFNMPMIESQESKNQYEVFKISNNPVREFIIEQFYKAHYFLDPKDFFDITESGFNNDNSNVILDDKNKTITFTVAHDFIFSDYKTFCSSNGYIAKGRNGFSTEFKRQITDLGVIFSKKKGGKKVHRRMEYCFTYDSDTFNKISDLYEEI